MAGKQNRYILILACATFLFFGMATAGIGPVLPELAKNANSSMTAIGGVLSALFLGAFISNLVTGPLCDRIGHKKVLITSLIILALGFACFHDHPVFVADPGIDLFCRSWTWRC